MAFPTQQPSSGVILVSVPVAPLFVMVPVMVGGGPLFVYRDASEKETKRSEKIHKPRKEVVAPIPNVTGWNDIASRWIDLRCCGAYLLQQLHMRKWSIHLVDLGTKISNPQSVLHDCIAGGGVSFGDLTVREANCVEVIVTTSTENKATSKISLFGFHCSTRWKCIIKEDESTSSLYVAFDFDDSCATPAGNFRAIQHHLGALYGTQSGSRLIQKTLTMLVESVHDNIKREILTYTEVHLHSLVFQHGHTANFVLQKMMQSLLESDVEFLFAFVTNNVKQCCQHRTFGRVIERTLERFGESARTTKLIDGIISNIPGLIFHSHGNYAVQKMIQTIRDEQRFKDVFSEVLKLGLKRVASHHLANNVLVALIRCTTSREMILKIKSLTTRSTPKCCRRYYISFVLNAATKALSHLSEDCAAA